MRRPREVDLASAQRLGLRATIFVPRVASPAKLERIRQYGADLVVGGEVYADALGASEEFVRESGALAVHAYDQPETMLGQGTVGLEIEADLPEIDTLLVAVGGGGLIGGIAAWFRGRVRIVAVEPDAGDAETRSALIAPRARFSAATDAEHLRSMGHSPWW